MVIDRIKNSKSFYIPYLGLFLVFLCYFFYHEHGDFVLFINTWHNPILDFFFKYWTHTGSWVFFTFLSIAFIIFKRRFGIILSVVGISVALLALLFKFALFPDVPRPMVFFESQEILKFVDGVKMLSLHSFPSGHSMAGFALATFLSLQMQRVNYSILFLAAAALTGVSRIYLAQHFLLDVMAGSLIGVVTATVVYISFEKYLNHEHFKSVNTPDEDLQAMNLDEEIEDQASEP